MIFYSIYGEILNLVVIYFGYGVWDIILIKIGNFFYIDIKEKIVNLM